MRPVLLPLILTCLCWLPAGRVNGQQLPPDGYWAQHFTDENGLPQNSVKAILKDRNGFVWLITEAGLVRFDGRNFLTFDRSVIPISSNRLRGFVPSFGDGRPGYQSEFYALSEKDDYIGIRPDGLVAVDTTFYSKYLKSNPFSGGRTQARSMLGSLPAQYPVDPFGEHYFVAADNGDYYIWMNDQITFFSGQKRVFTARGAFREFLLIGSKPYGIDRNGRFKAIAATPREISLEGDMISDGYNTAQAARIELFWSNIAHQTFIYLNHRLYLLKPTASGNLKTNRILTGFDFDKQNIVSAFYDETNGALFLGSMTRGLFVLKRKQFQTHKLDADNADNAYYAQIPGRGRTVLTAQGYLLGSSPNGPGTIARRVSSFMEQVDYKFAMVQNRDSTFWFGIGPNLYKLSATGEKVLAHVAMPDHARSLYVAPDGRLWIGCSSNALYTLDESVGKYTPRRAFTLGVKGVLIMDQENPETFLLGTETGLYRLNIRSGAFKTVKSLENMNVRSFYTTPSGTWITTYGNGIYFLQKDKLIALPLDNDRFLATAHCIVEDRNGYFWITTNRGLFQVAKSQLVNYAAGRKKQVYYLYYDKSSGFDTNEFNGGCLPCALTLADRTVSLPTMDGLVWFKPETVRPELPDKGIFINTIHEDGKSLPASDTLDISRDYEQLRLALATPYMGNVRNIHMQYALSGANRAGKWMQVGSDFVISLPKMSYGNYELKIRKAGGFEPGKDIYKTIYLRVPRAWYETVWFRVLAFLALVALFVLFVRLRTAHLLKKERENSLLRHYRVISQIMAAVHHDIQTPLHYIDFGLKHINTYLHKKAAGDPLIVRMSDESLNTSQRLNTLTKNILNYIKLQSKTGSARLNMEMLGVAELLAPVSKLFGAVATFREISIRTEVAPELTIYTDASLLSIILHNLTDNALKVSESEVLITASSINGKKQIMIENDGGEMPEEQTEWLNRRYKSYEDWTSASPNPDQKGIGLLIVKDLCMLLSINISASVPAKNRTLVTLTFQ